MTPVDTRPCIHYLAGACRAGRFIQLGCEFYIRYQPPFALSHRVGGDNGDKTARILFHCSVAPNASWLSPEEMKKQRRCEDFE